MFRWLLRRLLRIRNFEILLILFLFYAFIYLLWKPKPTMQPESLKIHKPIFNNTEMRFVIGTSQVTEQDLLLMDALLEQRYFTVQDFRYCAILKNSVFDGLADIPTLGGPLVLSNPDQAQFANLIDERAHTIHTHLLKKHPAASADEARRLACYLAAEGNNAAAGLSQERLLKSIDPQEYFKPVLRNIVPEPTRDRVHYKMAYLLMIHELSGLPHVQHLLERLDDGHAIILVHVDARPKSSSLYYQLQHWIYKRGSAHIHLAKNRFKNVWGHISLVFTQLSGFWELLDLADWDFVVNLSNYDYPIKSNSEIHKHLSKEPKNWIEYWPDTSDLSERFFRAHVSRHDHSSILHMTEPGILNSPFPHWNIQKHHQWMIVTPEFVRFLRTNQEALDFLAFQEHCYIPDESYFASVILNTELKSTLVNANKRYLRFNPQNAHPAWLGYPDRHLFPPFEPNPSFFFVRKFNILGRLFDEPKLVEWINKKHWNGPEHVICELEDASVLQSCFQQFADKIQRNKTLVVIPMNEAFLKVGLNLICTLEHFGFTNVVVWALDQQVHQHMIQNNHLSLFIPGFPGLSKQLTGKDPYFHKMLRWKPKLLKYILDAGYNIISIDADSLVLDDFEQYLVGPIQATTDLDTFFLYLESSPLAKSLLDKWQTVLDNSLYLSSKQGFQIASKFFHLEPLNATLFTNSQHLKHMPAVLHAQPKANLITWLSTNGLWFLVDSRCYWHDLTQFQQKLS
ncbi:core-2/I-branching enzyme-domain-containing protein [Gorgonomyces haynaldii]|nr:core-2/I-branching enzyme-domain-containing protein [Gorgonomyces haynaldii]